MGHDEWAFSELLMFVFVIAFVVYDGREIDLEDFAASKLKVNWTQKAGRDVVNGKLPDIKVNAVLALLISGKSIGWKLNLKFEM